MKNLFYVVLVMVTVSLYAGRNDYMHKPSYYKPQDRRAVNKLEKQRTTSQLKKAKQELALQKKEKKAKARDYAAQRLLDAHQVFLIDIRTPHNEEVRIVQPENVSILLCLFLQSVLHNNTPKLLCHS